MTRIPDRLQHFTQYAELPIKRGDWHGAVARWRAVQQAFPNDVSVAQSLNTAMMAAIGTDSESDGAAATFHDMAGGETGELLLRFESLGGADRQGCEFGLVQRDGGAEPLGLLRWTSVEPQELIDALEARFEGIGQPEQTVIETRPFGRLEEYVTLDTRFGLLMHTAMHVNDIARDKAAGVFSRRMQFLTRKLIGDLEAGEKIFVYRIISRDLTDTEIGRLHAAIRSYGNGTLFYVRHEDAEHANGTVDLVKPGLLVGYIDRFAFDRSGRRLGAATASWLTLCRNALAVLSRTV